MKQKSAQQAATRGAPLSTCPGPGSAPKYTSAGGSWEPTLGVAARPPRQTSHGSRTCLFSRGQQTHVGLSPPHRGLLSALSHLKVPPQGPFPAFPGSALGFPPSRVTNCLPSSGGPFLSSQPSEQRRSQCRLIEGERTTEAKGPEPGRSRCLDSSSSCRSRPWAQCSVPLSRTLSWANALASFSIKQAALTAAATAAQIPGFSLD